MFKNPFKIFSSTQIPSQLTKLIITIFSLWNPHLMLNNSINDWFNKDRNLNQLTQYLIDTHLTCLSIYNFSAQRLRSLKAYSQMMGNDEKNFSVELQSFVLVVSPTQIRIVCGVIHLEFYLLSANRVILDSCIVINKRRHVLESVPLFFEFWHLHSRGSVVVTQKTNMISGLNALGVFKNVSFTLDCSFSKSNFFSGRL